MITIPHTIGFKKSVVVRPFCAALIAVLILPFPISAQRGALTRPRDLGQLVEQSALIVRGHVVSARVEPHPELIHLATVVVKFRVQETLKGQPDTDFTFRQYIWDIRDRYDAAGYRKGQEFLLLMNPPTRYGLSSPAGLEQGRFRITRDAQGKRLAVNGHSNAALFRDLEPQMTRKRIGLPPHLSTMVREPTAGPVPLSDLEDLIRSLAAVNSR